MSGTHLAQGETRLDRIVQAIRQMMQGRDDASGVVTLAAGAASTVVQATNCASSCSVFLTQATANAAAEVKNGTLWVSAVGDGSFTITHANNAQVDRTFFWTARG